MEQIQVFALITVTRGNLPTGHSFYPREFAKVTNLTSPASLPCKLQANQPTKFCCIINSGEQWSK